MMTILSFILSLVPLPPQASAAFCDQYQIPKNYLEIKSKIDEKIKTFSNVKSVAKDADETLSKMISAKSPVIAKWLAKRSMDSKSEEEIVREWRLYYARHIILTKFPHENEKINKEIEKLINEANAIFASKQNKNKLQDLFEKSKKQSLKTIKSFPISDNQKEQIISRVANINLYWMKDFKDSKFKQLPMDFLDWGVAYDPASNEINIGVNSLSYPNDETYLAVFSHEIGHAFDSCRWGAFFNGEWPFQNVGECLRSSKSVGAKKRDDSKMDLLVKANKELGSSLKSNPTCNKLGYPPNGMQADQLPESFADWFSTETMANIEGLNSSVLRTDLCKEKNLNAGSSYPDNRQRLKAIYFAHPKFKRINEDSKMDAYSHCRLEKL